MLCIFSSHINPHSDRTASSQFVVLIQMSLKYNVQDKVSTAMAKIHAPVVVTCIGLGVCFFLGGGSRPSVLFTLSLCAEKKDESWNKKSIKKWSTGTALFGFHTTTMEPPVDSLSKVQDKQPQHDNAKRKEGGRGSFHKIAPIMQKFRANADCPAKHESRVLHWSQSGLWIVSFLSGRTAFAVILPLRFPLSVPAFVVAPLYSCSPLGKFRFVIPSGIFFNLQNVDKMKQHLTTGGSWLIRIWTIRIPR